MDERCPLGNHQHHPYNTFNILSHPLSLSLCLSLFLSLSVHTSVNKHHLIFSLYFSNNITSFNLQYYNLQNSIITNGIYFVEGCRTPWSNQECSLLYVTGTTSWIDCALSTLAPFKLSNSTLWSRQTICSSSKHDASWIPPSCSISWLTQMVHSCFVYSINHHDRVYLYQNILSIIITDYFFFHYSVQGQHRVISLKELPLYYTHRPPKMTASIRDWKQK